MPHPPSCQLQVGSIGFCMGGALSLAAAQLANINCSVPFYGTPSVSDAPVYFDVPCCAADATVETARVQCLG